MLSMGWGELGVPLDFQGRGLRAVLGSADRPTLRERCLPCPNPLFPTLTGGPRWKPASTSGSAPIPRPSGSRLTPSSIFTNALRDDLLGKVAIDIPNAAARSPDCGGLLVQRGNPTRTVVTDGDQTVRLTRSYQARPTGGAGLSPYR